MKSQVPRGFTLLEVVVAFAILAISLTVFLETQAASLANAGRARGLTVATLLTRSKMIDIEQALFDEGFTSGEQSEEGNFSEEGHEEITWKYTVSEIELELGSMASLCGQFGGGEEDDGSCESLMAGVGAPLETLTGQIAQELRAVELTVIWPDGAYQESMRVTAIVTRENLGQQLPGGIPGQMGSPILPARGR